MNNEKLIAALKYQSIELSIIPVSINKRPLIKWEEFQHRIATVEEIKGWWTMWPDANIALVTGKVSGIIALDLDIKHNRTSKEFTIPITASAKSGSGGEHFFFKYPNFHVENKAAISGQGVDIRGDGGYILLSPSINENGVYEWLIPLEEGLAELPEWLMKLLKDGQDHKWLSGKNGVKEGARNDTAASMAGKILSSTALELREEIGWDQFKIWNQKNNPPLDIKELRSVWESIEKKHVSKNPTTKEYKFTSLSDLLEEPEEEINWIVDGLLPSGGFSIVVAKPKVGKSTLVRQLALSIAHGENFLGRTTIKGRVLYIALEEKRSEVKAHFKLLGADGTEDLEVYVGFAPEEAIAWLEREIKRKKTELVIIDTLFRFARVNDVSDYAAVTKALDPLLRISREHSTHLMVLHHARKSQADGADATLGSTAIFGTVDIAIILKRTKNNQRTIETQQRYGVDIEETIIDFNPDLKSISLGGTRIEADTKNLKEEIILILELSKEPINEDQINDEIEGKTALKRQALRDLLKDGQIIRTGGGKKGDRYLYSRSPVPTIREEQESDIIQSV